jgi:hypothetical protein
MFAGRKIVIRRGTIDGPIVDGYVVSREAAWPYSLGPWPQVNEHEDKSFSRKAAQGAMRSRPQIALVVFDAMLL